MDGGDKIIAHAAGIALTCCVQRVRRCDKFCGGGTIALRVDSLGGGLGKALVRGSGFDQFRRVSAGTFTARRLFSVPDWMENIVYRRELRRDVMMAVVAFMMLTLMVLPFVAVGVVRVMFFPSGARFGVFVGICAPTCDKESGK